MDRDDFLERFLSEYMERHKVIIEEMTPENAFACGAKMAFLYFNVMMAEQELAKPVIRKKNETSEKV